MKFMISGFVNIILGSILSYTLNSMGYDPTTWQWWVVVGVAICLAINSFVTGGRQDD